MKNQLKTQIYVPYHPLQDAPIGTSIRAMLVELYASRILGAIKGYPDEFLAAGVPEPIRMCNNVSELNLSTR